MSKENISLPTTRFPGLTCAGCQKCLHLTDQQTKNATCAAFIPCLIVLPEYFGTCGFVFLVQLWRLASDKICNLEIRGRHEAAEFGTVSRIRGSLSSVFIHLLKAKFII